MSFLRRRLNLICRLLVLAAVLAGSGFVRGQNVILHLRGGDRIAGVIVSENTNQLVLSNTWIKELTIPVAEIERRIIVPPPNSLPGVTVPNLRTDTNLLTKATGKLPENTNTFWKRWKGDVSVGMEMEKGAVNHDLYYGRAKLTYAQPYESDPKLFFRNIFTYDAEYGKTDGTLSDNRMGGSSKTDFDVNPKFYVYNLGAAFYDEVRAINLHYEEGPGLGYHWFTQTNFTLNLELGANYQVEYRTNDNNIKSAYFRLGQDMMWRISKQMTLTEKFEYFPRADRPAEYRMRFESTLTYALLQHLSWNWSVIDFYDTQPAAGIPNNDLQIRTSLGVKF